MAYKNIVKSMNQMVSSIVGRKVTESQSLMILGALLVGLIATGGFYGYRWYRSGQEEVAQRLFSQNVQEFERVAKEGKKEDWASVETLFKIGYNQYPHSAYAPFFLVYEAQALSKQDKADEARKVLEQATHAMSSSSPLYPLFKIKLALMRMDSNAQEAIAQLQVLASDSSSHFNDAAAYYLGQYYWINNEEAKAKEVWQKMIDATKTDKKQGQSPWAQLAQATLAQ